MSRSNKPPVKDMYWFAHGGPESEMPPQRNAEDEDPHSSNSPSWSLADRRSSPDEQRGLYVTDANTSSGPASLENDRLRIHDKRQAVEERKKLLLEAEQERNDALLRKHMERDAALEARRNAQRSNISFAFGSSVPRYVEPSHVNEGGDTDIMSRSFTASGFAQKEENHDRRSISPLNCNGYPSVLGGESHCTITPNSYSHSLERKVLPPPCWLSGSGALVGDDIMSRSMSAAIPSAPRGRRKNDLMPVVFYDRNPTPRTAGQSSTRKRSVSMTRLDQLAQPRKHYVEANKANSTVSSGPSNVLKDLKSPSRPLSSASEHSGGSGRLPGAVTRRMRTSPRKARPISIAGTFPDHRQVNGTKPHEARVSPTKRTYTPIKKTTEGAEVRKCNSAPVKSSTPKSLEKAKPSPKTTPIPKQTPVKASTPKATTPKAAKPVDAKTTPPPKQIIAAKPSSSKIKEKKPQSVKKKLDTTVAAVIAEVKDKLEEPEKTAGDSTPPEGDAASESEKNAKRVISEEEARAALAEKRRLAREQAEREAEVERQRQEQLRLEEEERLRQEEEDQRRFEEEQLRLLEEHRLVEEEKLRKAIEEQERKEEEEKARHEEEMRLKIEQERKAKEEAEKQRLELEEKLRKEEEERAERKKRLEKIMSRTRGKSSNTSPSGSVSGSDQLDSGENQQEHFSSGANSLDSNEGAELTSEQASIADHIAQAEGCSIGDSMEANPTYEIGSENESLNSNDLMMPISETASQENSLTAVPDKGSPLPEEPAALLDTQQDQVKAEANEAISETDGISADSVQQDSQVLSFKTVYENEAVPAASDDMASHREDDLNFVAFSQENPMAQSMYGDAQFFGMDDDSQMQAGSEQLESVENVGSASNDSSELAYQQDNFKLPDVPSSIENLPPNFSFGMEGLENKEEADPRSSVSSDIKLPDPLDETSDEGSISSEKQHAAFAHQDFRAVQENNAPDDVFSEQPSHSPGEFQHHAYASPDAFSQSPNFFSEEIQDRTQESQAEVPSLKNLIMADKFDVTSNEGQSNADNSLERKREENSPLPEGSTLREVEPDSKVIHAETHDFNERGDFCRPSDGNEKLTFPEAYTSGELPNAYVPASNQEGILSTEDIINACGVTDKEQPISGEHLFASNPFSADPEWSVRQTDGSSSVSEQSGGAFAQIENASRTDEHADDVTFIKSEESGACVGKNSSIDHDPISNDFPILSLQSGSSSVSKESGGAFAQIEDASRTDEHADDVTFIKSEESGACIGIISSIDHDHISNDFPILSLQNEQLKNFEFASMTDSEDNSSLDSNLSQVMPAENGAKDTHVGLNHVEHSAEDFNSKPAVYSNGAQPNPFENEHGYDCNPMSKISDLSSNTVSNGHGLEPSGPAVLGGVDLLRVDHSKSNLFDSVDAIGSFERMSPEPFASPKGSSKQQMSGNPFLL